MSQGPVLRLTWLGWGLFLPVVFLSLAGLATIYATADGGGSGGATEPEGLGALIRAAGLVTLKQVLFILTGIGLMGLALWPSYQKLGQFAYPFYGFIVALLALLVLDRFVDLPLIPVRKETRRWIEIGQFTIQPSEFMKLALVVALARYLRFRSSFRRWSGLIPPFLLTLGPMVLILFQPDLGTLLMLLPVLFGMLFVAGRRIRHLATIILAGCATLPLFYLYGMHDYQKQRIDVLIRQGTTDERWHMDQGYQLRQSKIALGTGGVWGEGYGRGVFVGTKLPLLPEAHNDFIFAIIGHQWGLVGCAWVIAAYIVLVLCGLEISLVTNDPFGRLLAVGVTIMIVMQALLNMCMTIGLAPITGMPLPFVSAGGSSMWTNFAALGLLVNVAKRRPMLIAHAPFEHDDDE